MRKTNPQYLQGEQESTAMRYSLFFVAMSEKTCIFAARKKTSRLMKTFYIVLILAVVAVALMMGGLGVKMLLQKEKEFRRPCANADPKTGRCAHCTCDLKKGKSAGSVS